MIIFQIANKHLGRAVYQKGGDGGAGAQADATKEASRLQNEQFNRVMAQLAPYMKAGQPALNQLQNLSTLQGQNQALNQYYNSDQYNQLANQARYQSLAASEATGGLGSTATSNQLASIAPTLGQSWLSGQMQNYSNLLNVGMNAAAGQASAGQNYANNAGALAQQLGAINASRAQQPSAVQGFLAGGLSGASAGAAIGTAFGGPGIGTAIGAGVGALGSLF